MGLGKLGEVPVRSLLGGFDPRRQMRDTVIISDLCAIQNVPSLHAQQQGARLRNIESVLRRVGQYVNKTEFPDRACG